MSLTVSQYPQPFTPAYNDQFIYATSSEYAQPNFKYTVTVTVNGDVSHTEGILPRPDGSMVFNARKWVENYITHYFNPDYTTNFFVATGKTANVTVTILEDYGASPVPSVTTIQYTAFDASLTETEFYNYDAGDYVSGGNNDVIFLGQTFNEVLIDNRVSTTQQAWLHFTLGDISYITLTFDDGVTINTVTYNPVIPSPSNTYDIYCFDIDAGLLGAIDGSTVDVKFYNVSNVLLATHSFTVTNICSKYVDYPVYYLNRFGNIPFFHFEKKSIDKLTKKINTVRLGKNQIIGSNYTYNTWDREVHVVSTESVKSGDMNTDWITETQSTSLQDLFDSPIVHKYENGIYTPITVKETTYDFKKRVNDKLFNYTLSYEYTDTKLRQRGI